MEEPVTPQPQNPSHQQETTPTGQPVTYAAPAFWKTPPDRVDKNGNTVPGKLSLPERLLRRVESRLGEDVLVFDSRLGRHGTMFHFARLYSYFHRYALIGVAIAYALFLIPAINGVTYLSFSAILASALFQPVPYVDTANMLTPWWITVPLFTLATTVIFAIVYRSQRRPAYRIALAAFLTTTLIGFYFGYVPALIPIVLLAGWWIWIRGD